MAAEGPCARRDAAPLQPADLGPLGRTWTLDDPRDGHRPLPARALLEGEALADVLAGHGDDPGGVPAAVAASTWLNHAVTVLALPVLAAWTLHGAGLDARPGNVRLHLEDGLPRRVQLRDQTPAPGDPNRGVETLMGDLLTPLFRDVEDETGLDPSISWGTTGTLAAWLYDHLEGEAPDGAPVEAHRRRLLETPTAGWSDEPNPLQGTTRREPLPGPDLPDEALVRSTCCMKRQVPSKGPCRTCPEVDPDRRAALLRDDEA